MPDQLDPIIRAKLKAFGRRWRALALLRGLCCAVITFLGAMLLAATMDWLFILSDGVRWTLAVGVYAGTLAVVWFFCLKPLLRAMDIRVLARLVEKARPDLREDLLAAVELSDSAAGAKWDSPLFRERVQAGVAERMRDLRMEKLLPPRLVSTWLRAAVVVVIVCGALSGWGDGRQLMARALAPGANLDRVSRTKIEIIEPNPAELLVPLGDNLPVVVRIIGPEPEKVTLETQPLGGRLDRVVMSPQTNSQFTATIPVGSESLVYRVRAGDGITRLLTVVSKARPHVAKFEKKFRFPEYSKLPAASVTEESGDLKTLEGTDVDLSLHLTQPVKEAALRVVTAGVTNVIPLAPASADVLTATVPVKSEGTYTVHLIAAETGFENKFSPQYEIRPQPDLVPRVTIDEPKDGTIVAPEEIVNVIGSAQDDIGLKSIAHAFQVNGGEWVEVPLMFQSPTNAPISQRWDLLTIGVGPGDQLLTKLIAVDLKGGRAESPPVRVTISSAGFDPNRTRGLLARRVVLNALDTARKTAEEFTKTASSMAAQKFANGDEAQRRQIATAAMAGIEEIERNLDIVSDLSRDALKGTRAGRESADLALIARVMSTLKHERAAQIRASIEAVAPGNSITNQLASLRRAVELGTNFASLGVRVFNAYRDIYSADEADILLESVTHLSREQERILRAAAAEPQDDSQTWQRLQRREMAAVKEAAVVDGMFKEFHGRLTSELANRASVPFGALAKGRTALEKSNAESPKDRALLGPANEFQKSVAFTLQHMRPLTTDLGNIADRARVELAAIAGSATAKIEQLKKDAEDFADATKKGEVARAANTREILQRDWQAAIAELKDLARIEETRRDSAPQFAADTTVAASALNSLRTAAAAAKPQETVATLQKMEQSMRTLEAAHRLSELDAGLKNLSLQERWDKASADAATARPKDLQWIASELKAAATNAAKASLPEAVASALAQIAAAPEIAAAQQEMAARQSGERAPVSMREPIEKLDAKILQAQKDSAAAVGAARAELAQAAPKLSDQLAGLAKSAEDLQKAADTAAKSPAAALAQNAGPGKLLEKQNDLNRQVQETIEAIRRDANVQDISKPEGRERARDADDAVAMLREPPPKAADALRQAANDKDPAMRAAAMNEAVKQEQKLSGALQQLAKHFANAEAGKPEATRAALRKAEEELGVKSALDSQYAQAEKLMEMLAQSPQQMLAQLEKELAANEAMRKELQAIARDALNPVKDAIQQAAQMERKLAEDLKIAGKTNEFAQAMAEQTKKLADEARQMAAQQVPAVSQEAQKAKADAAAELERAQKELQAAADKAPADAAKDPQAAAKQVAEIAKPLQDAARDLQAAAAKAAEAAKTATEPAQMEAAKAAQAQAEQAAQKAGELAQKAESLAKSMAAPVPTPEQAMAQAASQQSPLAAEVAAVGMELQRAARHEARLGTAQGEALQKVGEEAKAVAENQIPAAQKALANPADPAAAQTGVQAAAQAIEQQMAALASALAQSDAPKPPSEQSAAAMSPEQSKWMARALDRLDAQLNGMGNLGAEKGMGTPADGKGDSQPGEGKPGEGKPGEGKPGEGKPGSPDPGSKPGQGGEMGVGRQGGNPAAEALAQAAQEQMAAMRAARAGGQVPGEDNSPPATRGDGSGSLEAKAPQFNPAALPQLGAPLDANWAKLPPKVAQGLMEARREQVATEYRNQVDAYFRAIADRAKEKKP